MARIPLFFVGVEVQLISTNDLCCTRGCAYAYRFSKVSTILTSDHIDCPCLGMGFGHI